MTARGRPIWTPPKGRYGCGRDPSAGPGTCALWWHSCPKPEKNGCYLAWAKSPPVLAYWASRAPAEWAPVPPDFPQGTGAALIRNGVIEGRAGTDDAPPMWRRRQRAEQAA